MSRAHVILAHGTEEPTAYLQKFAVLQHLAPCYLETWEPSRPAGQQAFAIGNFVRTDRFSPGNREQACKAWDLPADALIVLSVAAIKKKHKRVDYLLREFAAFEARYAAERKQCALLLVAGGREPETEEVMQLGRELLGDKVRFLTEVSREKMPSLYQTADIFALASQHEMMPIALLEALSSGLPIACNDTPTLRWMAGPAGTLTDITQPGALMNQLMAFCEPQVRARFGSRARFYAENTFSESVILREINAMYEAVMEKK